MYEVIDKLDSYSYRKIDRESESLIYKISDFFFV